MTIVSLAIHLQSNTLTQAIMFTYETLEPQLWEDSDEDSSEEEATPVTKTKAVRKQKAKHSTEDEGYRRREKPWQSSMKIARRKQPVTKTKAVRKQKVPKIASKAKVVGRSVRTFH